MTKMTPRDAIVAVTRSLATKRVGRPPL